MLKTIHCTVEENYSQTPLKVVATIVQGYLHPAPIGRSAHTGSHAQTGRVSEGGGIRTLNVRCVDRNLCARSGQKSILCHLCMDRGNVGEKQRAFGTETRTVRVSVLRRRGPAGLRDPIAVSLAALMGFTVLLSRFVGTQKIERLFFGWYKISIAPEADRKPRKLCLFLL